MTISTTLKNSIIEAYSKEDELKKLSEEKEVNSQLLKEVNKRIEELKFKNIDIEKNKDVKDVKEVDSKIMEIALKIVELRRQLQRL